MSTRLISIESQPKKIVVVVMVVIGLVVVVVHVVVVIISVVISVTADIEFVWVVGGGGLKSYSCHIHLLS